MTRQCRYTANLWKTVPPELVIFPGEEHLQSPPRDTFLKRCLCCGPQPDERGIGTRQLSQFFDSTEFGAGVTYLIFGYPQPSIETSRSRESLQLSKSDSQYRCPCQHGVALKMGPQHGFLSAEGWCARTRTTIRACRSTLAGPYTFQMEPLERFVDHPFPSRRLAEK